MIPLFFKVSLLLSLLTALPAQELELRSFPCGVSQHPTLIVNGSTAKPGQLPWMVSLKVWFTPSEASTCSGSIITKRHVLTAANCVVRGGKEATIARVRYGSNNRRQGKTVDVKKVVPHPWYRPRPVAYDAAVLEVTKPFQYSIHARPVCLPRGIMGLVNKNVVTSGWGVQNRGLAAMDYLQYTVLKIQEDKVCKIYEKTLETHTMICAFKRGTGSCFGDSGGPVATKLKNNIFVQVGIISYGGNYQCASRPKVFTRVDVLVPWIQQQTKKERLHIDFDSQDSVINPISAPTPYYLWSGDVLSEPEDGYLPI